MNKISNSVVALIVVVCAFAAVVGTLAYTAANPTFCFAGACAPRVLSGFELVAVGFIGTMVGGMVCLAIDSLLDGLLDR